MTFLWHTGYKLKDTYQNFSPTSLRSAHQVNSEKSLSKLEPHVPRSGRRQSKLFLRTPQFKELHNSVSNIHLSLDINTTSTYQVSAAYTKLTQQRLSDALTFSCTKYRFLLCCCYFASSSKQNDKHLLLICIAVLTTNKS